MGFLLLLVVVKLDNRRRNSRLSLAKPKSKTQWMLPAHMRSRLLSTPEVPQHPSKIFTPHPVHTISILSHSCGFRASVGRYASGSRSNRRLGLGPVTQVPPTQSKNGIGHHPEILPLPKLLVGVKRPAHPKTQTL